MDLRKMMEMYYEEGLSRELAAARVCQDVVLKAIAIGPLNRNVTIKGGVVMRSLTNNNRRATRDIDLDFIHYSIGDEAIQIFVQKMNCIPDIRIEIVGDIEELKHQDYHGKSIKVRITDKNEQTVVEKLRALLIFGVNDRRYKDIYDMYYLKDELNIDKFLQYMNLLIFKDGSMRENTIEDIVRRIENSFKDKNFLKRISASRQRWIDEDIERIVEGIVRFYKDLSLLNFV